MLGTRAAQPIDSDPDPSDAEILHELYPPDDQAEGRRFLHRLERASQSGEIPNDFHVPARTTDAQVAAEDPWLRSDRNYRELAGIGAPDAGRGGAPRIRWCRRSTCSGSRLGSPAPNCGCSRARTRFCSATATRSPARSRSWWAASPTPVITAAFGLGQTAG